MAKKIKEYLKQEENILVAIKPCTITLDMTQYDKDNMRIEDGKIWVKSLISKAEFPDKIIDITLDYSVELKAYKLEKIGKEYIKLHYEANSTILEVSTEAAEIKGQIAYVERLIGGRELLKDASHLFRKILAVYAENSDMDGVHLEVVCSQVLRDKNNLQQPARLARKWDPVLVNLKKVIFSEGFINGLAFENINDAIKTGLISEERVETSIIERVMTGTLKEGDRKTTRLGTSTYRNR
jgi:hypothetical protein